MTRKDCTRRYRELRDLYELGLLVDEEREEFEKHYIECEECFDALKEFEQTARLLREDEEVLETASQIADDSPVGDPHQSQLKRLIERMQPYRTAGLVAAAVLIVIVAAPLYYMMQLPARLQVVELIATRGQEHGIIDIEEGGEVKLLFLFAEAEKDRAYQLYIRSFTGEEIFSDGSFTNFNRYGIGRLFIDAERFSIGNYKLVIATPEGETLKEYLLKAE